MRRKFECRLTAAAAALIRDGSTFLVSSMIERGGGEAGG